MNIRVNHIITQINMNAIVKSIIESALRNKLIIPFSTDNINQSCTLKKFRTTQ
jgi:hypothetical protein